MYCVIKCIVRRNQARVKNADLLHPSCTVVMYRRKSASPVHNVLRERTLGLQACPQLYTECRPTNCIDAQFNDAVSGSSTEEWRKIYNEELTGLYSSPIFG